ncbi:hypothetical protein B296_00039721 [Ensete ventricosum]|uniref:Uncharacterized protein n=1 Tax=Ensete ventricosum TaxID=4639 RepID=A0A426ZFP6_ENSVE|nr:hypothetical protein B296_00039721 [Ensete ventricosum]
MSVSKVASLVREAADGRGRRIGGPQQPGPNQEHPTFFFDIRKISGFRVLLKAQCEMGNGAGVAHRGIASFPVKGHCLTPAASLCVVGFLNGHAHHVLPAMAERDAILYGVILVLGVASIDALDEKPKDHPTNMPFCRGRYGGKRERGK